MHDGRVLGLFCFDSKFLAREDFSPNRFAFFMKTLRALRDELRAQGGDLLVVDAAPMEALSQLIEFCDFNDAERPSLVTWCRDYEPFARARDQKVAQALKNLDVPARDFRDHLLFEPSEIVKDDGSFYQVYSPYARRWLELLNGPSGRERLASQSASESYFQRLESGDLKAVFKMTWKDLAGGRLPFRDALESFERENATRVTIPIPDAGFRAAYARLLEFRERVGSYSEARDIPAEDGTSRLSMYLKNGSLTVPQILAALDLKTVAWGRDDGVTKFVKELAWREFYYQILWHRPDVETGSFLPQYRQMKWEKNEAFFHAWQEGKTGYPIVDAGMRELATTGWMHNRVRMIVASFLTKDLLINWQRGENHFMKLLLDGDLAPNNGGWQWAASTGCDPQPYFRIFNPWLQSKKFDPNGDYIRKYVPELADVPAKALHTPDADRGADYPAPIVAHDEQRGRALAMYEAVR